MRAMVLRDGGGGVELRDVTIPEPGPGQVRIKVNACGVCRTDLHVVDGDLSKPLSNVIPGHEVVGTVEAIGPEESDGTAGSKGHALAIGDRVGVPWLGHTCGHCDYCRGHQENLCDTPGFTGYTLNGGYAEFCVADAQYVFPLPDEYDDPHAAPLLCAGLIGYRSWAMVRDAKVLGLYGFGAAAHIIAQVAMAKGVEIHAFTSPGDIQAQDFARGLGAVWAGGSDEAPVKPLDAAIIFAPVGGLVPAALQAVRKGGTVVCAGIHMSDIPSFPYSILWEERVVRSVANLTRADGDEFMALAAEVPIETHVRPYPLAEAQQALDDLRAGRLSGAAVLIP
ncbi:zinc-binding alcohol dehydrogenase family protein [Hwanghaeella grinnelliae]|uniref:Zinc-binding alcohol dehydrogenase family protein n=2 Tax=Hwanghaeella grinnelliae TaxID=2500179 RepID=A0A437QZ27_9PROT|nr:zinc-binding alcohol dehydrogenase family protein [Hwanghaeella grinnelliae]